MSFRFGVRALFSFVLAAVPAVSVHAGQVDGTVTLSADGSPVHGARVLVLEAGRSALTNRDGRYHFDDLAPGRYTVLATREHLRAERQAVELGESDHARADFSLRLSPVHEEVTVTAESGVSTALDSFSTVTTLDAFELSQRMAGTLGEVLESEPGVAKRGFGPGSSRPIIRGFDGDRVLILQDGIRSGDLSSQSGDHGVTIDPGSVERIEVLKGPMTLLYGSNAVGGVVNAITRHEALRDDPVSGPRGHFTTDGGTANEQAAANGSFQYRQGAWGVWAGGGARRTSDVHTPEGPVENSATRLYNGTGGVGFFGERAYASVGVSLEDGRYGIPFADEFHGHGHGEEEVDHEEQGEDEEHGHEEGEEERLEIDLDSRRRSTRLDLGLRELAGSFLSGARLTLNRLEWEHDELEVEGGAETVGTSLQNDSWVGRLELAQKRSGRLSGRFGLWGQTRDYAAAGEEALSPPVQHDALAGFLYEEIDFGRFRVQVGGRVEWNDYSPGVRPEGGHSHEEEGDEHGDEEGEPEGDEHEDKVPASVPRSFAGFSGSLGLHRRLGGRSALVLNLTRSSRAPALEELYNFGPHVGNLAFEVGNPDLAKEEAMGVEASLRHDSGRARGRLGVYYYDIDGFVFPSFTGEEVDGLLEAEYLQGDSRFLGVDAQGSLEITEQLWLHGGLGWVDAELTTGEALPRIPPLHGSAALELRWNGFHLRPELDWAARQGEVFREETTTPGYAVFNVTASWVLPRSHAAHIFTLRAYNLGDRVYRNHTSFIKDLAPETGRGVMFAYALRWH